MDFWIYILLFAFLLLSTCCQECSIQPDESNCIQHVECVNTININFHEHFRTDEYNQPCSVEYYDGRYWMSIYLTLKNFREDIVMLNYHYEAQIITGLDLSNNDYFAFPTFVEMENLKMLNLSSNSLSEAKLCNANPINELSEIDLSHNTIANINVNQNEYVFRKLHKINLSHNYFVAIQDAIFDSFPELEVLDLSYNFIDTLTKETFEGVKNLVYLNLKHNRLSELDSSLFRFTKVEELDLSENKIQSIKFVDFEKFNKLKVLDLSSNMITAIEVQAFSKTNLLKTINLKNNLLENFNKATFANLTNLADINLSKNNFKVLPKDLFKDTQISEFCITQNKLEGSLVRGTFEGFKLVSEMDLSFQQIEAIENFAFFGLEKLITLLLNNNQIETLSEKAFDTLGKLETLDLSNNKLTHINFNKIDLISLQSLFLNENQLVQVKHEYFDHLEILQFLDLSHNNISKLETHSFKYLRELQSFQISHNPISGTLEKNTFDGLNSLPSLDISGTSLTVIKNESFSGMTQLKELNMSHSTISELQFNSFLQTGLLETIDLSCNQLKVFNINTTELINLVNLILNDNIFTVIPSTYFKGLPKLSKLVLSNNKIVNVDANAFEDQKDIRFLDFSFNVNLKINVSQLEMAPNLDSLLLSGVESDLSFKYANEISVPHLEFSHANIKNITSLALKKVKSLNSLVLSHNNLTKVEADALYGVKKLRTLDLSFNRITFIQPGAFKDNTLLHVLNVSHNLLTVVSYGIFRGLLYLDTIDISYNEISDLQSERFYEVQSLSVLIADHNKITFVNAREFSHTSLTKLSIGDNPIPCNVLVNLKKIVVPFAITALRLDENSDSENVDGVTCNKDKPIASSKYGTERFFPSDKILIEIKNILHNISLHKVDENELIHKQNNETKYFDEISSKIETNNANISKKIEQGNLNLSNKIVESNVLLKNISFIIADGMKYTNLLLGKILNIRTTINTDKTIETIPQLEKNITADNLVPYVNKIKQTLEDTIAAEKLYIVNEMDTVKQNIKEMETKISLLNFKNKETSTPVIASHEAYSSNESSDSKSFIFIEVCVGLMLIIMVLFILYKFYNSGMFVPSRHSTSTRQLSDAMENSAL